MSFVRIFFCVLLAQLVGCGPGNQAASIEKNGFALSGLSRKIAAPGVGVQGAQRAQQAGTQQQLLKDPGLENGAPGWTASEAVVETDPEIAYSGNSYAHLAGYNEADDWLFQDVTIPANASSARLRFVFAVVSDDVKVAPAGDRMVVAIHDPQTGSRIAMLAQYTNTMASDAWMASDVFDLAAYAGRTVRLRFHATSDESDPTSFLVDDLALAVTLASAPGTPSAPGVYPGKRSQYTISVAGSGFQIRDHLSGITSTIPAATKRLRFADATVALDTDGVPGMVYRLYQAAFDRVPDKAGLGYWISEAERAPYSMDQLATFFMGSDEFRNRYGNPDHRNFLLQVYRNVLHREGDPAGVEWYLGNLNSGGVGRSQVLASFAESAENKERVRAAIARGIEYIPPATSCGAGQVQAGGACVARPRATGSAPGNGATGISTAAYIRVIFDQPMDSAARPLREGAITVSPMPAGFTEHWENGGTVWRLEPPANWATATNAQLRPMTRYTATVLAERLKAANGGTLGEPYAFSFTTGASCERGVVQNGVCAPACTPPQVATGGQCVAPANPACPAGQVLQNGVCVAQPTLPPACPVGQSMVNGVCTAPPGAACSAPRVQVGGSCITPMSGVSHPRVVSVSPANRTTVRGRPSFGVEPIKELSLSFDREMSPAGFSFRLVHTATKSETLANYTVEGRTVRFRFMSPGAPGEWKVVVRNGKDKQGVVMQDFESTLNVTVDMTVSPPPAATLTQATPIVIKFHVPMDPATINDQTIMTIFPGQSTWHAVSYDAATNTATVKPIGRWPGGMQMYLAVTYGVKSAAGQSLSEPGNFERTYFIERGYVSDPPPNTNPNPNPNPNPDPDPDPNPNPAPGTGSTAPDNDGCFRPRRAPACVVLTRNEVDASGRLWTNHKNTCGARVAIRVCHQMSSGKWNCGMSGIANNASYSWSTGGARNSMVAFTGSTKPSADFICTSRDPGWPPSPN